MTALVWECFYLSSKVFARGTMLLFLEWSNFIPLSFLRVYIFINYCFFALQTASAGDLLGGLLGGILGGGKDGKDGKGGTGGYY